jgi:FkbM family methyltransferase
MRSALRRFAARRRHRRVIRSLAGPRLLRAFADEHPSAVFLEVGSNDGEQHDHLRPYILSLPWRGVMVEPVPYVFERLRRNYGELEDRIALENVAVGERDGTLPFWYLRPPAHDERESLPDWYDGVGSFSRETILDHADAIPDLEERLVCAQVPSLTFDSLCKRHGLTELNLLLMDTEGWDWEILKDVDLDVYRPEILVYEHYHLAPSDRMAARRRLEDAGYATMEEGFDTFCLGPYVSARLRTTWERLRPGVSGVYADQDRR